MKIRFFTLSVVVLCLVAGTMTLFAQQRAPQIPNLQEFIDSAMAAIPPLPPMPPMPDMPPMPNLEGFSFSFGGQSNAAEVDPAVRFQQEVFRTLLRSNPERALDLASERLKADPGDPVVIGNLSSIASSGSPKALPLLISIAKTSTNAKARNEATLSISRNRDGKDSLTTLEDIYASSSDNVELRRTIVSSLSRTTDPRSVSVLARIAKNDPDESVRRSAVQYLGMRKEPEALKALEDLLKGF